MEKERLEKNVEVLQAENFAGNVMLQQLNETNDRLQSDNDQKAWTIETLRDELNSLKQNQQAEKDKVTNKIKEESKQEMAKLKAFMTAEVDLNTLIKDKMIDENKW